MLAYSSKNAPKCDLIAVEITTKRAAQFHNSNCLRSTGSAYIDTFLPFLIKNFLSYASDLGDCASPGATACFESGPHAGATIFPQIASTESYSVSRLDSGKADSSQTNLSSANT